MKHTPEPWTVGKSCTGKQCIYPDTGRSAQAICLFSLEQGVNGARLPDSDANAERIVACVNAFAGIADPTAFVAAAVHLLKRAQKVREVLLDYPQGQPPRSICDFGWFQTAVENMENLTPTVAGDGENVSDQTRQAQD